MQTKSAKLRVLVHKHSWWSIVDDILYNTLVAEGRGEFPHFLHLGNVGVSAPFGE